MTSPAANTRSSQSMLWLLGQPHLGEYLSFVARHAIDGASARRASLVNAWRRANDYYARLEQAEAGAADLIDRQPLPAELAGAVRRLRASRSFRNTFDTLPTTIEMVELDRLIVWQTQVADAFARAGAAAVGPQARPADLFDFCLPVQRAAPPVQVRQIGSDHFQLISDAPDLTAWRPRLLAADRAGIADLEGPAAALIGLPFGFGANLMSAIASDQRLVLHNGYHRAFGLRALGYTHAPCIIQHATRRDELNLVADSRVAGNPAFYYRSARPPLLKDFFDPRIAHRLLVKPSQTIIDIRISSTSSDLIA